MQIQQQTSGDKLWRDEQGTEIPFNRITPTERKKEKLAFKLAKEAAGINEKLSGFKATLAAACDEVLKQALSDKERTNMGKGNITWYNFDGSIKIEMSVNENIEFDSILIEQAKQKLLDLVGESISSEKDMIKELVLAAFQTSKGRLDTKKILGLKKHASRIKDKRYHEAMELIDNSIRRPDSKTYYRVSVRNSAGAYEVIDLNISSI